MCLEGVGEADRTRGPIWRAVRQGDNLMKFKMTGWVVCVFWLFLASLLAGCRSVHPELAAAFSSGVSSTRIQSQQAFEAVGTMVAEASIDYAAAQEHLVEAGFLIGLDQAGVQAWEEILEGVGRYAQHLQLLTEPRFVQPFEEESIARAGELNKVGRHLRDGAYPGLELQISPAVATSFTSLGGKILQARAQAHARQIIRAADADIARICAALAQSVGGSPTNGLRGTAREHWNELLAERKAAFLNTSALAARRQIATAFSILLQRRGAQDDLLLALSRSLLRLGELHHALAAGQSAPVRTAALALEAEVRHGRELYDRFNLKLKTP